ncbi:MAG: ATP synthase F0 subunit B [Myxococcota bacterium]
MRAAADIALSVSLAAAAAAIPTAASAADLNLIPHWPYVATNVVVFGLLIYPVNRLLIAPLLRLAEERERRTAGALDEASRLDGEASAFGSQLEARLVEARKRAQARRAAIMADAESQERALLEAASADAARSFDSVRASIADDLASARLTLETDARSLADEAAARLLGRPV